MIRFRVIFTLLLAASLFLVGDTTAPSLVILAPSDSVSYDAGKILLVSVSKDRDSSLLLSTQFEKVVPFGLEIAGTKESFAADFYRLFDPNTTIQTLSYSFRLFKGYTKVKTLAFTYADSMNVRRLWQRPEFAQLVKEVQKSTEASEVLISLKGWVDSLYVTEYDDPTSDGRALYKIQFRLVPGVNNVYCAPGGRKAEAVAYVTSLAAESSPIPGRPAHFHNSTLEQSCSSCHDGLPSADSGASMKADCNVCHKTMSSGASYLHSPAEMKECGSCHSWSAESKSVTVTEGVPTACYTCHDDKQAQVDSSAFPHPVAGECATCHSPHGTDQKHILKTDVYTLCTGCHEEQKANHPVGRHPMRFAMLRNGEAISCVSCHNPHGSNNEGLLRASGGRMEICGECH
jgi:predicted CXXCH cytochrome family protein